MALFLRGSQISQPFGRRTQCFVPLGEAESHQAPSRRLHVERREWNRRDAGVRDEAAGERHVVLFRQARVVDELEVCAAHVEELEWKARDERPKEVALRLIEWCERREMPGKLREG